MKLLFLATTILSLLTVCHGASGPNVAGIIESINCPAELIPRAGEKPIPLDRKRDKGRVLFPGESVLCTSNGSMKLMVFGREAVTGRPGVPYPIPFVRPQNLSEEEQMRMAALEQAFRRAGRERSGDGPEGESITPKFLFIVLPVDQVQPSVVGLRDGHGKVIWHGTVNNTTGFLDSDAAREVVSQYQKAGGGVLTVEFEQDGKTQQVKYFVLSRDDEEQLNTALNKWNSESSLFMIHIGKAGVFYQASLFESAGQEYEAASSEAPDNDYLRQAALEQYQLAGDEKGVSRLSAKLSSPQH